MFLARRWLNGIRRRTGVPCLLDRGGDHTSSVFVAGTARSGTTWLSQILNYDTSYRYIFEPFNNKRVPIVVPFGSRPYRRPDSEDAALLQVSREILEGRIRSRWTDRFNYRLSCSRRLIKCIRANLMLGWLRTQFPEMPIVLLLRHPVAVARSYARQGWKGSVEPLLAQSALVEDFLKPHKEKLERASDALERAAWIWSLETIVPLTQLRSGDVHVVFYEELLVNPVKETLRLFEYIGRPFDRCVLDTVGRPSLTSRRDGAVGRGVDPLCGWCTGTEREDIRRLLNVVEGFGLDALYSEGPLPNTEALWCFRAFAEGRIGVGSGDARTRDDRDA